MNWKPERKLRWKIQPFALVLMMLARRTMSGTGGAALASKEFCRWETFNATCPSDGVVLMRTALYGRMREGRCLETNYSVGCWKDVLLWVDELCSGRRQCRIEVPNRQLHEMQPCAKDLQTYLEASYECVRVETGDGNCGDSPITVDQRTNEGYLANAITDATTRESVGCPWVIRVDKGQRINVTLFDFSVIANSNLDDNRCHLYATITEKNRGIERVCGGRERIRNLYMSSNNELQINVAKSSDKERKSFMIKYQAVGCPDVVSSDYSWTHRNGDHLTIGCNCTGHAWHLVCKDTRWIGDVGQCQSCHGLLFSIIIGVVLGILLGVCLLAILVICRRRGSLPDDSVQYYEEGRELEKEAHFLRTSGQVRDASSSSTHSGFVNPSHSADHHNTGSLHSSYALIRDSQTPRQAQAQAQALAPLRPSPTVGPGPVTSCYGGYPPPGGGRAGVTLGRLCDSPVNDSGLQSKMSTASYVSSDVAPAYNDVATPE